MERNDIILIAVEAVICAALCFAAGVAEKWHSSKIRLLWLIPAALCIMITMCTGAEPLLAGVYIACAAASAGFFTEKLRTRRIACAAAAVLALIAVPMCLLGSNYRSRIHYVKDFDLAFRSMKEHYALSKHKNIDWNALYEKYMPQFREAEDLHDDEAGYMAWARFCAEFHDGHVYFAADKDTMENAQKNALGNDHGIVIMTRSDGKTVAVNVDPSLFSRGIRNGTEIISWNVMAPAEADKLSEYYYIQSFSDKDNRKFYEGILAAGTGGDNAEVVYRDSNGTERTITLPKLASPYSDRYEKACDTVERGLECANMHIEKLNDTVICLRIKFMNYDLVSGQKENFSEMADSIREEVTKYRSEGVRDIIIDIRSNGGGSGGMVKALASLFAPEGEHYFASDALWDSENNCYARDENGNYITDGDNMFSGENILGDSGRVILLVNAYSASASDHLAKVMSRLDNTTVIGFTGTCGIGQGICKKHLESGELSFSSSVLLNRDGSIFMDAGTDDQSEAELDVMVPFDEEAIAALFDRDEDYLLDRALEMLN